TVTITSKTTSCGSASASGTINVNQNPTVSVNSAIKCANDPAVIITATPGIGIGTDYDYTWIVPSGVTNPGNVQSFSASVAGTYSVIITNKTTSCASASASGTLTVNSTPDALATPTSQTSCSDAAIMPISLSGSVAGTSFDWTRDNTTNVTGIPASGSG